MKKKNEKRLAHPHAIAAAIAVFGAASPAMAGITLSDTLDPFYFEIGNRKDGVARVLSDTGSTASAVMIGDEWAITSAHVVYDVSSLEFRFGADTSETGNYQQYFAQDWYVPTDYDTLTGFGNADVALVRLSQAPSPQLDRYQLYSGDGERTARFTNVGYGLTGTGQTGGLFVDGLRRGGYNRIDGYSGVDNQILNFDFDVDPDDELYSESVEFYYADINGVEDDSNPRRNSWDYRIPLEYRPAGGDSGSPYFIGDEIVGIHSFSNIDTTFGTTGGALRVSSWRDWIYSIIDTVDAGGDVDQPGYEVLVGRVGDPIGDGGGADSFAAAQRNFARLAQDYIDPLVVQSLEEKLQLLGFQTADATIEDAAAFLGFDVSTGYPTEEQMSLAADTRIDAWMDDNIARIVSGGYGEYGFLDRLTVGEYVDGEFQLFEQFVDPDPADPTTSQILYGDMNIDGTLDLNDVLDFVMALVDVEAYEASVGLTPDLTGDMNTDDLFNFSDIAGFAAALNIDEAAIYALIPEPTTGMLLTTAVLAMVRRRRSR